MARKRKVGLPRVTLMAYSRRDLLAFTESVEALRHLVDDLRLVVAELRVPGRARGKRKAAADPSDGGKQWGERTPPADQDQGEVKS